MDENKLSSSEVEGIELDKAEANNPEVQGAESAEEMIKKTIVKAAEGAANETVNEKPKKTKKEKNSKVGFVTLVFLLTFTPLLIIALLVVCLYENGKTVKQLKELAGDVGNMQTITSQYNGSLSEMNEKMETLTDFADRLSSLMGEEMGASSENDVVIGGEYTILSTEEISDAYKSGDLSKLDENQKKTVELAVKVIDEVIEDDMTDYEKEFAIYEWICSNIKHDDGITVAIPTTGEYADNPLGVLTTHKAVCVGYATTFRLFMQMLDIECMVVHDSYLSHSWDIVKIEGDWYHADAYMDAETNSFANFNMNDDMCFEGHDWDTGFFPNATGTEYCYVYKNAVDFESLATAAQEIRDLIEGDESGSKFYKITGDDALTVYAQMETMLQEIDNYVMSSEIGNYSYLEWYGSMADAETVVFCVVFTNYEDGGYIGDISDEDIQSVYDVLDEVFGDFYEDHDYSDYWDDDWDDDWGSGVWEEESFWSIGNDRSNSVEIAG